MKAKTKCPNGVHEKKNFTLVELLIVVAIIAILAGMLLPALNTARAKAQSISCLSKIKQLNLEMNMYADTYNDFLPPRGIHGTLRFWVNALDGTTEVAKESQRKTVLCPSLEQKDNSVLELHNQSYGLNVWITGISTRSEIITAAVTYKKRGRITGAERKDFVANTTSGVMLFGDSIYTTYSNEVIPAQYFGISVKYNSAANGAVHFRHPGDAANLGMLDGSAASMNFQSAYQRSCITAGFKENLTYVQKELQ